MGAATIRFALAAVLGSAAALLTMAALLPELAERMALVQWAQVLPQGAAALGCALVARHVAGSERAIWALFAAALGVWAATDAAFGAALAAGAQPPEISAFDAGWLLFYVPMLAALLLVYRRHRPERGWQGLLDGVVLCLAVGLMTWKLVLEPVAAGGEGGAAGTAVNLAYPVLDAVGLTAVAWLVARHRARVPRWLAMAAGAFALQTAGNLAHLMAALNGIAVAEWASASVFALSAGGWALAALSRHAEPPQAVPLRRSAPPVWTQAVPFALAAALAAVLVVDDTPAVIAVAAGALGVCCVRVAGTLSVNGRLLAEQARYRSLFTAMTEGVLLYDATGAVSASNPAAERILGLPPEVLRGERPMPPGWRAVDEEGRPLPRERFPGALTLATGAPCHGRVIGLAQPGGELRWISASSDPVVGSGGLQGVVVTFTDVTEEREAAAALRRERDFTDTMLESLNDGLSVVDAERRIVRVNDRLCEITGFTREELVGAAPPFPYHVSGPEPAGSRLGRLLDPAARGEADMLLRTKGGELVTVALSAAPLWDGERLVGGVRVYKDVTARRRAERALRRSEARHRALAAQMGAMHRVAAAVAGEREPRMVHDLVAREALELLDAGEVQVLRFRGTSRADVVGASSSAAAPEVEAGMALMLRRDGAAALVARTGRAAVTEGEEGPAAAAPVMVAGATWGAVVAGAREGQGLPEEAPAVLAALAELAGLAVRNDETRTKLADLATSDPLTALPNHRAFHERLAQEVAQAERHRQPLSLMVLDIDHFKRINDEHGHQTGDRVLRQLAARAVGMIRSGEMLGRVGGEEFAWVLPQTDVGGALIAAERLRGVVAMSPFEGLGTLTVSIGVAALEPGGSATELFAAADAALYRAKAGGRDRCEVHRAIPDAPPLPAPA